MKPRLLAPLLCTLVGGLALSAPAAAADAWAVFQRPPAEARPFVRWWWNGNAVNEAEIRREIDVLHAAGFGGFEINPILLPPHDGPAAPRGLEWLSPEWIRMVKVAVETARSKGMIADLIVGSGWPFGGEFLPQDFQVQRLDVRTLEVKGPGRWTGRPADVLRLEQDKPQRMILDAPFELKFVHLLPAAPTAITDARALSTALSPDGTLTVDLPAGPHQLVLGAVRRGFTTVSHGAPGAKGPVLDHYNRAAVRAFLDRMSDALNPAFGGRMGNAVRAVFCDSIELSGANWTGDLPAEFRRRRGYDLAPWLPWVVDAGRPAARDPGFLEAARRARYDFCLTLTELFSERFILEMRDWAHRHGMLLRYQAYGLPYLMDLANSYRLPDIPESNSWNSMAANRNRDAHGVIVWTKYASSGGHLAGRRIISTESHTNTRFVFRLPLWRIKADDDENFLMGVNHQVVHGFNYSPPEAGIPGWVRFGTYFSEHNPWWPWLRLWSDRDARLAATFQRARPGGDVAILAPTADIWSEHGLARQSFHLAPQQAHQLWKALHANGVCADYVSEAVLREAQARDGALAFGPMAYRLLVVAGAASLEPGTAEALARLAAAGVRICWIEPRPLRAPGLERAEDNSARVRQAIAAATAAKHRPLFRAKPPAMPALVAWADTVLTEAGLDRPIRFAAPQDGLSQIRYHDGERTLFFVLNQTAEPRRAEATIPSAGHGLALWDPATGQRFRLPDSAGGKWKANLGPFESRLLVVENASTHATLPPANRRDDLTFTPALTLPDAWDAEFRPVRGAVFRRSALRLGDLGRSSDPALANFAGQIVYRTPFDLPAALPGPAVLDLGGVHDLAEVTLDGRPLGVHWEGFPRLPLPENLAAGRHTLEVRVATVLFNHLRTRVNESRAVAAWISSGAEAVPAGLIGPVTLQVGR